MSCVLFSVCAQQNNKRQGPPPVLIIWAWKMAACEGNFLAARHKQSGNFLLFEMKINSQAKAAGVSNYFCASSLSLLDPFSKLHSTLTWKFILRCVRQPSAINAHVQCERRRVMCLFLDFSGHKSGALFAAKLIWSCQSARRVADFIASSRMNALSLLLPCAACSGALLWLAALKTTRRSLPPPRRAKCKFPRLQRLGLSQNGPFKKELALFLAC